ncbi:MAG: hypothetical protein ABIH46_02885 [Chloroflexota bacterium]
MLENFRPRFLATANNSTPHTNAKRACDIILESISEAPILPNLPRLGYLKGIMRTYEGMPCLMVDEENERIYFDTSHGTEEALTRFYEEYLAENLDYFAISRKCHPGLHAMLDTMRESKPKGLRMLKGGVAGPVTTGMKVTDENNRPVFYNDAMMDAVVKTLVMKVKWQEKEMERCAPGVLPAMEIGEPLLALYGSAFAALNRGDILRCLNEVAEASHGLTYVHCCANTDWTILMESKAHIISFDAYGYAETLALYPQETQAFLERGGMLAWGIVPTADEKVATESADTLIERLERAMQAMAERGVDRQLLLNSALVTPSCGTGAMSVAAAEKVYRLTRQVSAAFKMKYFGGN